MDVIERNESLKKKLKVTDTFENNYLIHILIDIHLNPKILITQHKIQEEEYNRILVIIEQLYEKSRIAPGEMVGAIAAQSIGEPATQMIA